MMKNYICKKDFFERGKQYYIGDEIYLTEDRAKALINYVKPQIKIKKK